MKITKSKLRQIIREELSLVEQGFFDDARCECYTTTFIITPCDKSEATVRPDSAP